MPQTESRKLSSNEKKALAALQPHLEAFKVLAFNDWHYLRGDEFPAELEHVVAEARHIGYTIAAASGSDSLIVDHQGFIDAPDDAYASLDAEGCMKLVSFGDELLTAAEELREAGERCKQAAIDLWLQHKGREVAA